MQRTPLSDASTRPDASPEDTPSPPPAPAVPDGGPPPVSSPQSAPESVNPGPGISTFCANHPDRPALAMCMTCRKRICQTCSTEWEGIHNCTDCLALRRRQDGSERPLLSWLLLLFGLGVLYLTLHGTRILVAQIWGTFS